MRRGTKVLIGVLVLLVLLAGAACAYWWGYDAYLTNQWQEAAERIEASNPAFDVVCVRYFGGKHFAFTVDVFERSLTVNDVDYPPYTLVAVALADADINDDDIVVLLNTILEEVHALVGKHGKVIFITLSEFSSGRYAVSAYLEMHTTHPIRDLYQENIIPVWGQEFLSDLVLFPGRE